MGIQEQYVLVKKANGDVGITQNSVEVFTSINASAVVNTLVLKEGKVGIGTDSPNSLLQISTIDNTVYADSTFYNGKGINLSNSSNTDNSYIYLRFVLRETNSSHGGIAFISPSGNNSDIAFITEGSNVISEKMRILGNGNIGIGLNSPATKLHVQANVVGSPLVKIKQDSATGYGLAIVPGADASEALYINNAADLVTGISMWGDGRIELNNDGTNTALYIHQDGVLASSKYGLYVYSNAVQTSGYALISFLQNNASSTSPLLRAENNGTGNAIQIVQNGVLAASKYGLYIYSNTVQVNSPLVYVWQNNASSIYSALEIDNNGTGRCLYAWQIGNGTAIEIDNDGTNHGLYIHQDGVLAASKYGLFVYSNAVQVNSPLVYFYQVNASSVQTLLRVDNHGQGSALYITQDEVLRANDYGLCVYSNAVQVNSALVNFVQDNASSDKDLLVLQQDGTGHALILINSVYDDIQFPIASGKLPAANYPNWETFTTNTAEYAFSVDDYIDCQANELAHWWKQGTAGHIHLHFTIKTAQSTGQNRFVKFSIWVAYADTDEVWVEQTVLSAEKTIPTGSGALKAFYLDIGDATLTNYLIGGQVKLRVKRIAATGGTEYADDVYITQVGMHVEKDTLGSRTETVK
jgi:hypothetical protein